MIKLVKAQRKQDPNKHIPYTTLATLGSFNPHKKDFKQLPSIHQSGQSFQSHFNLLLFHARIFESANPLPSPSKALESSSAFDDHPARKKPTADACPEG